MSDYKISVNGRTNIMLNETLQETDVMEMLEFDENQVEDLLQTHAAFQAYWEALAIKYQNAYEEFKEGWHRKWWAHNKMYSKYVLAAYGDTKPTVEAIKDTTILIYSQDTEEHTRKKYSTLAYTIASKNKIFFDGNEDDFYKGMFEHILSEVPWYFESVVATLHKKKTDAETIKSVADRLNAKSFHMNAILNLVMAKSSNMGPQTKQHNGVVIPPKKGEY